MGVDIGVCYYSTKRETKLIRLEILSKLPGEEGKEFKEELYKEYEVMGKEIKKDNIPELHLMGYRMFNLYFEINTGYESIEFSFYKKYCDKLVVPKTIERIIKYIEKLLPIASKEERKQMEYLLTFFKYLVSHNMMIYPS